jgi:hypothetical protein
LIFSRSTSSTIDSMCFIMFFFNNAASTIQIILYNFNKEDNSYFLLK